MRIFILIACTLSLLCSIVTLQGVRLIERRSKVQLEQTLELVNTYKMEKNNGK